MYLSKKGMTFISIFILLFLLIGCVSASEELSDSSSSGSSSAYVDSSASYGYSVTPDVSSDSSASSGSSASAIGISDNEYDTEYLDDLDEDLYDYDDPYYEEVYLKSSIEYSALTKEYTPGNIVYKVTAYDVYECAGDTYDEPMIGSIIKLRVYTGKNYKDYSSAVNSNSLASVKIPNLSLGTHKVLIYVDNDYWASSSIKIVQAKTKVTAPAKTVTYKQNANFQITIKDSSNKVVKNVKIKVKVYTGKKYKTYNLKTNSKGVATFKTNSFSIGSHKVVINSNNKNYKISKTTKLIVKAKPKVKTVTLKVNTLKRGEYYSKKCTRLQKGDAVICFKENTDAQFSKGVHVVAWYLGNGDGEDLEPHHTKLTKATFYFKNSKGKIKTKTVNGDKWGDCISTGLMKGFTPFKVKVWYTTK